MTELSISALDRFLTSREFLEDPYPILHTLRKEAPVHWSDSIGGWILTRYDDIVPTFRDISYYSNEGRLARVVEYLPPESRAKFRRSKTTPGNKSSPFRPTDHTRLRALLTKVFNATSVEAMRPDPDNR